MTGLMRGVGIGAGLVTMGYGIYRLGRGEQDWMAPAAIAAGLSMALAGMAAPAPKRTQNMMTQVAEMAETVARAVPRYARPMMRKARKQSDSYNRLRFRSAAMPVFR